MNKSAVAVIAAVCAAFMVSAAVSCGKQTAETGPDAGTVTDSTGTVPEDTPDSLGTYVFGETSCDIYVLRADQNESFYYLLMSPLRPGEELSTYVVFGLDKYWCDGQVHDINDPVHPLDHNDDYYFVYEDPVHYYSQFREFREGTVRMSVSDDWRFDLSLDVLLIDGTPFKIDISRVVEPEGLGM